MDFLLIFIFIIVIILIIYVLFSLFVSIYSPDNTVYAEMDLNKPPIEYIPIKKRTGSRYAFAVWIYINNWNTNDIKLLINKGSFTIARPDFKLYLDKTKPNLIFEMASIQSGVPITPIVIMPEFPLQKWTYLCVSVDNQLFDGYINGKMVVSRKLEALPQNNDVDIYFGNGTPVDARLNEFQIWNTSIDPSTVWYNFINSPTNAQYPINIMTYEKIPDLKYDITSSLSLR